MAGLPGVNKTPFQGDPTGAPGHKANAQPYFVSKPVVHYGSGPGIPGVGKHREILDYVPDVRNEEQWEGKTSDSTRVPFWLQQNRYNLEAHYEGQLIFRVRNNTENAKAYDRDHREGFNKHMPAFTYMEFNAASKVCDDSVAATLLCHGRLLTINYFFPGCL